MPPGGRKINPVQADIFENGDTISEALPGAEGSKKEPKGGWRKTLNQPNMAGPNEKNSRVKHGFMGRLDAQSSPFGMVVILLYSARTRACVRSTHKTANLCVVACARTRTLSINSPFYA